MELKKSLFGYNVQSVTDLLNQKEQYYMEQIKAKEQVIESKTKENQELLEKIAVMEQQQNEMLEAFKAANDKIKEIEEKAKIDAELLIKEAEDKRQRMYDLLSDFRDNLMNIENSALDTVEKFLYGIKELERSVPTKDKLLGCPKEKSDEESQYEDAKELMHAIYELSGRTLAIKKENI